MHTHRDTGSADDHLYRTKGVEQGRRLGAVGYEPLIRLEGKSKTEHVLKYDHACQTFDSQVACSIMSMLCYYQAELGGGAIELTIRINDVKTARNSTDHHTTDLEGEKHQRHGIAILAGQESIRGGAPAEHADAPKDELRDDQDDAELGLIYAAIAPGHDLGGPVGEPAGDEEPDDGADEGGRVRVAGLDLVPPQRVPQEEGAEDDADEHGPADQGAPNECRPQEGGLQEERERPQC